MSTTAEHANTGYFVTTIRISALLGTTCLMHYEEGRKAIGALEKASLVRREAGGARAVFVDRDGVLNDLVFNEEEGRVTSPVRSSELRVPAFVPSTVKILRDGLGYKVIVISNQPGVAKGQFTLSELEKMNSKIRRALAKQGTSFDGEYYCLHHPAAKLKKYRVVCDCRKPKPGLLLKASREGGIDLGRSFFVGDSFVDVKAGKAAGCRTILVGHSNSLLLELLEEESVAPDFIVGSFADVPDLIERAASESKRKK
jgi:D-glycero-D-manno-heptose 1,7-bisphosphate phosphatase